MRLRPQGKGRKTTLLDGKSGPQVGGYGPRWDCPLFALEQGRICSRPGPESTLFLSRKLSFFQSHACSEYKSSNQSVVQEAPRPHDWSFQAGKTRLASEGCLFQVYMQKEASVVSTKSKETWLLAGSYENHLLCAGCSACSELLK